MKARALPEGAGKTFLVSRHLQRARAFLACWAPYINPGIMERMAEQLALVLIQENSSDVGEADGARSQSAPPQQ